MKPYFCLLVAAFVASVTHSSCSSSAQKALPSNDTIAESASFLSGSNIQSLVKINKRFHQIVHDPQSRLIQKCFSPQKPCKIEIDPQRKPEEMYLFREKVLFSAAHCIKALLFQIGCPSVFNNRLYFPVFQTI